MRKAAAITGLVGGILIFASAFAHAFAGWPAVAHELAAAGVGVDLTRALRIGWHFGSASMAGFGLIVIGTAWRKLRRHAAVPVRYVAGLVVAVYVLFGATALATTGLRPHFILFVVLGLLVAPLLAYREVPTNS